MTADEQGVQQGAATDFRQRLGVAGVFVAAVTTLMYLLAFVVLPRAMHRGRIAGDRQMVMAIAQAVALYELENAVPPVSLLPLTVRRGGGVWSPDPQNLTWWFKGTRTHGWGTSERPWYAKGEGIIDRWGWPYLYSAGDEVGRCVMVAGRGPDGEWAVDDPLTVYSVPGASPGADDILAQKRDGGWVILQGDYCKELAYLSSDR